MANWLKKTIDIGGQVTTVLSIVPAAAQTAVTTALTAMTAYFGYQELGIARAIFLATGVMAFGMSVVFFWARISQMLGTFQRLSVIGIFVPNAAVDGPKGKVLGINVHCVLRNDSQQMMFYKIRRAHLSIERIGPKERTVDQNIVPVMPNGGTQTINFATVEDVPFQSKKDRRVSGGCELEIEYGPAMDELKYLLFYTAELVVLFNPTQNPTEFRIEVGGILKSLKHSRI